MPIIIWGYCDRDRVEDSGAFECPECSTPQQFSLVRTWNYFHLYFISVAKNQLIAERIVCSHCGNAFPITVLSGSAKRIATAFEAGSGQSRSLAENFGNVVSLTSAAADEIKRRHARGDFDSSVVARVEPDSSAPNQVYIAFDYAQADGRDWIGESQGIPIIVDRQVAPELQHCTIDFRDGVFIRV